MSAKRKTVDNDTAAAAATTAAGDTAVTTKKKRPTPDVATDSPYILRQYDDIRTELVKTLFDQDDGTGLPVADMFPIIASYAVDRCSKTLFELASVLGEMPIIQDAVGFPDGRLALLTPRDIFVTESKLSDVNTFARWSEPDTDDGVLHRPKGACWDAVHGGLMVWSISFDPTDPDDATRQYTFLLKDGAISNIRTVSGVVGLDPKRCVAGADKAGGRLYERFRVLDPMDNKVIDVGGRNMMGCTASLHPSDADRNVVYILHANNSVTRLDFSATEINVPCDAEKWRPPTTTRIPDWVSGRIVPERVVAIVSAPSGHLIIAAEDEPGMCQVFYFDPYRPLTVMKLAGHRNTSATEEQYSDGRPLREVRFKSIRFMVVSKDRRSLIVIEFSKVREIPLPELFFDPIVYSA